MPGGRGVRQAGGMVDADSTPPGSVRPDADALVGVLAHELRTPITTIYAGSAVLARDQDMLPSMRRELAADVCAEAARLFRSVEDLLVLTRLEHGALAVAREPVALARAVDTAARLEASRWPGLRIHARTIGSPPPAAGDNTAIEHVLRNIIASVGTRSAGSSELEILVSHRGPRVRCRLIDRTGTLTRADTASLFDLPRSGDESAVANPSVGMFVARELMHAMSGDAWAIPRPDGAVEIGVSLPRYESG
jgi:two-component system sensor histidine kinase KdpD